MSKKSAINNLSKFNQEIELSLQTLYESQIYIKNINLMNEHNCSADLEYFAKNINVKSIKKLDLIFYDKNNYK